MTHDFHPDDILKIYTSPDKYLIAPRRSYFCGKTSTHSADRDTSALFGKFLPFCDGNQIMPYRSQLLPAGKNLGGREVKDMGEQVSTTIHRFWPRKGNRQL
jgi:hypothetical protein